MSSQKKADLVNKNNNFLKKLMAQKLYPGILQIPVALIFAFIIYELAFGEASPHDNFGTAMTWVLWWPLIPLLFILFGRLWCGICPFATLSDLVQKFVGLNRPVPNFLKKYGIWIIDASFILITWADHVFGIVENPRGSAFLLMLIVVGVVFSGAFFERRTWCRYLCFLGGLSGNYSRAGALELRATPEICATCKTASCYKGNDKAPGCPMFEFPRTMDTNASCNLCGYCVKSCPNGSITVKTRIPTRELWNIRKPAFEGSFLAIVIMGIVFIQNITMLAFWPNMLSTLESLTGTTNYFVTFTITFIIAMGLPILFLFLFSALSNLSTKEGVIKNFARFGYALIPLDLAGHLAHNLYHLLAEGKAIFYTFMGLFGSRIESSPAIMDTATIQVLQYMLVFLGMVGSLYTAYRIAKANRNDSIHNNSNDAANGNTLDKIKRRATGLLPHAVFIILLTLINFYLFYVPMGMRM